MLSLEETVLVNWHQANGAKMVEFAGFYMPVHYQLGVLQEHLHTRSRAGLFDVSHMGQIQVRSLDGDMDNIAQVLERIFPADLLGLAVNSQCYSLLMNSDGGVVDDLMICRRESDFLLIVNAGCKEKDLAYIQQLIGDDLEIKLLNDRALLALQGPSSETVLNDLGANVNDLIFMQGAWIDVDGIECWATRSGYTGEDGFELSVASDKACDLADVLCKHRDVEPIGLGARDSLRLESGLCLYGHELNESITPIDASLTWAIAKIRRAGGVRAGGFIAASIILDQIKQSASKKRIGLVGETKIPVREGAELFNQQDEFIGTVVSGGYGPSIERPVAMAMIDDLAVVVGQNVFAQVRKKRVPMTVVKTPFIQQHYKR